VKSTKWIYQEVIKQWEAPCQSYTLIKVGRFMWFASSWYY